MFEALILLLLVGGIVGLARRWPDVERRVFPDRVMAEPSAAKSGTKSSDRPSTKAEPAAEPTATPTAKGFMAKRPVTTEPDVDPAAVRSRYIVEPVTPPVTPSTEERVEVAESVTVEESVDPTGEPTTKTTVTESVSVTESPTPGGLVTGTPARPSEPAYFDATGVSEVTVADLASEIDRAYRERDYESAEQTCLKLLAKDPRNHKYMTRLGQIYQEMGQLEDAKDAFEEAKKLDPKNFFVLNRLTEVERLLSDKGGRTKAKS